LININKVFEIIFGGPYLSEISGLESIQADGEYLFNNLSGYERNT
jgi:hypothetical protein